MLKMPFARLILKFDVFGRARHTLLSCCAIGSDLCRSLSRKSLRKRAVQLVSPSAIVLYDFVVRFCHTTLLFRQGATILFEDGDHVSIC